MQPLTLRHTLTPGKLLPSPEGATYVIEEELTRAVDEVVARHVGVEEGEGITLLWSHFALEDVEDLAFLEGCPSLR